MDWLFRQSSLPCEVRSYVLSVFFVLLSFSSLLDVLVAGNVGGKGKARAAFAVCAILACLSHYFAFFLLRRGSRVATSAASLRAGTPARISHRKAEARRGSCHHRAVAAAVYTLYAVHAGALAQIQNHLLPLLLRSPSAGNGCRLPVAKLAEICKPILSSFRSRAARWHLAS